ncbi:hypothetical protein KG112_04195 [Nocardioides sp. zg-ZUI104]|uniref:hypothetical protein n=1 Tax=Nocardioides faecalis TaxID=2803858 RepID=UPI001BD1139C|nr:hypothetical protein [Nocardioides faecalis]MBS4752006.1 hypothetical protein [Nocardioides faecalis]
MLEAEGRFGPELGGYCADAPTDAWFDRTSESYAGTIEDTSPASTYFVYGEPDLPGVRRVRVRGAGFAHEVALDPGTGGFAVALPELGDSVSGDFAQVDFLTANGTVLGTRTLSEK